MSGTKRKHRISALFLIACLLTALWVPNTTVNAASKSTAKPRMIHVVYDDSGSMAAKKFSGTPEYIDRWSQALYAMEVFGAMMDTDDVMTVYKMSNYDKSLKDLYTGKPAYTLRGNDPDRLKEIHKNEGAYGNTPFNTVTSAGSDLLAVSGDSYERWLVVITDGRFNDFSKTNDNAEQVQKQLNEYNKKGIRTIYLGIGEDADALENNGKMGYAIKASDGKDLITKLTTAANWIFHYFEFSYSDYMRVNNSEYTLKFDIPVGKLIVFAQGDKVSVDSMKADGKSISPTDKQDVKYSDNKPQGKLSDAVYENAPTDTSLKGVVMTYKSSDSPYPSGEYSVNIKNAERKDVKFYFSPGVDINVDLLRDGYAVDPNDELFPGEYKVEVSFINPLTGERVESKLLEVDNCKITLENGGTSHDLALNDTVNLTEGKVSIDAVADLEGNVQLNTYAEYIVYPTPIELDLRFSGGGKEYAPEYLGESADPVLLTIYNKETGEIITEEQWNATELNYDGGTNIDWIVRKGTEVGTWEFIPKAKGLLADIIPGLVEVGTSARFIIDNQQAYGTGSFNISIGEYQGTPLILEFNPAKGKYDLNQGDVFGPALLTVYYLDDKGNKCLLNETTWNNLLMETSADNDWILGLKKINWKFEKGDEVSTFYVTAETTWYQKLFTAKGEHILHVDATGNDGELSYSGSGEFPAEFIKLTFWNWLKLAFKHLSIPFLILLCIIGWIFKKRIPNYRAQYTKKRTSVNPQEVTLPGDRIKKNGLTVILPFVPERGTVVAGNTKMNCPFDKMKIVAASSRSFRIINGKSFTGEKIKINHKSYKTDKDVKKLQDTPFAYNSFKMVYEAPPVEGSASVPLGEFSFQTKKGKKGRKKPGVKGKPTAKKPAANKPGKH